MTANVVRETVQLSPFQYGFRHSNALYRGFVGGRGAGKTFVGSHDMAVRAKRDCTYLIASPDYTMLHDTTLPTFREAAQRLRIWGEFRATPRPSVTLTTGAIVRFRSADDPDKLRGSNLSGAWLDEGSLMAREARDIVIAALREHGQQGWLTVTFTPRGLQHWTYDLFGPKSDGSLQPNTETFHAETRDNPFIPAGFHEQLAQQYTGIFAEQELSGRFVALEGAEFDGRWFHPGIWFDEWPGDIVLRCTALDPSKGRTDRVGDYSAFVMLGLDRTGTLWCDADLARRKVPDIIEAGLAIFRQFKPRAFAVETNAFQSLLGDEFMRAARKCGIPAFPAYGIPNYLPKPVRIRSLAPILAQGKIRFKRSAGSELLVQQLRDWPQGKHDDGPDALEQGVRMMMELMGQHAEAAQHGRPQVIEG